MIITTNLAHFSPILWIWIRIRKDSHHFGNLYPDPDPHPHQIKIRIRIRIMIRNKIFKLYLEADPDYYHIFAFFKGFEPFFQCFGSMTFLGGSGSGTLLF